MNERKKIPPAMVMLSWVISLFAFSIGFWHAHLGLKEMRPLSFDYGSLVLSGLILLVLILAYNRAIAGVKNAVYIYALCALFMFIFNLNSFYPAYLGNKLIKEDATRLKDTLDRYNAVLAKTAGITKSDTYGNIAKLRNLKTTILSEINGTGTNRGVGTVLKSNLTAFNTLASSNINLGTTKVILNEEEQIKLEADLSNRMDLAIRDYIAGQSPDRANGYLLTVSSLQMDSLVKQYAPRLTGVEADTASFELTKVKTNNQIRMMKELVSSFDGISKAVNAALKKKVLPELNNADNQVSFPQTQELGRLAHTLSSIFLRSTKIDTWGVLVMCFFIDFVVPFAVYFLIRRKDGELEDEDGPIVLEEPFDMDLPRS